MHLNIALISNLNKTFNKSPEFVCTFNIKFDILILGNIEVCMDNLDLNKFNIACEDFIAGKYILANIKIKAIINAINESEKLTDLVSSCLDGFDFATTWKESVTSQGLIIPNDDKSIIAYCLNVLYNLNEGSITLLDLLNKYFSSSKLSGGEEFKLFVNTIIKPFKLAINNEYNRVYANLEVVYQNEVFYKLIGVAEANINNIDEIRLKEIEREELKLLLTAIKDASERKDKQLVYTIMVGIDYFVKFNKRAKNIYLQLKDCFERI